MRLSLYFIIYTQIFMKNNKLFYQKFIPNIETNKIYPNVEFYLFIYFYTKMTKNTAFELIF